MEDVRYGIIGSGMMGVEHIENINALRGASVTALADNDPISRKQGEAACDGPVAVFENHRELLDSGLVDVAVVATPNHTHRAVLEDVLSTGVHVLAEKPLCTTVEDCRAILAIADATAVPGRVVQVGMEYRYMPPVARLIDEVHGGRVGTPRMVAIREHRFPFLPKVRDWNSSTTFTGGTLVEKCCHFFDLMNHILGDRPVRVYASGGQDVNRLHDADMLDNAFVVVDFSGGARASLDLCMFAEATAEQEQISVVGDKGKVEAALPSSTLTIGDRARHGIGDVETSVVTDPRVAHVGLHHGSSYLEHLDLLAATRGERGPSVSLEDGLWAVAMGVAAHRSIQLGRPVEIEEVLA